jgi:integrase
VKSYAFAVDSVRQLIRFGKQQQLLPEDLKDPFGYALSVRHEAVGNYFGEPAITIEMAADFLRACDQYQFTIFIMYVFFGLRAAEPVMLFNDDLDDQWLTVACCPELHYRTKGRRTKKLPLFDATLNVLPRRTTGLLVLRRSVWSKQERPPLLQASRADLIVEFRQRITALGATSAEERLQVRDQVLHDAGATSYDQIRHEFCSIHEQLAWSQAATIKSFRACFATSLANAGVPDPVRQYLMGHALRGIPLERYTHVSKIRHWYQSVLDREWQALLAVLHEHIRSTKSTSEAGQGGDAA